MKLEQNELHFDGPDYEAENDRARLTGQIKTIYEYMSSGRWKTLREIEDALNYPQASISAQLRHLRKPRFGGHTIEKQRRGDRKQGLFEYRLVISVGVDDGIRHECRCIFCEYYKEVEAKLNKEQQ